MNVQALENKAAELRLHILRAALKAGKGHVPPAFSWVEIGVALFYGGHLNLRPHDPKWENRDRFILSKGHGCLTLYAMLADLGFFPKTELDNFCGPGSLLAGHPDTQIPGVEGISGSLGHGLGLSAGLALGAKLHSYPWKVVTVMGDGECQEGSVWEAAMFASHHQLHNLVAIIDRNGLGATNYTEKNVALEPFVSKWKAFGWEVVSINGHSFQEINKVLEGFRQRSSLKPLMILAQTVKGKGVSFMEASVDWHHRIPKGEEVEEAIRQLMGTISSFGSAVTMELAHGA
ncbi:transketolase [Candidatus Nitrospira neomarina]|uniref:Transketolase n=1 Tax=Candidatus Nitrospira neomarina TaxID=3020899 RepID=A0AA96GJ07_9BACT|nr:transketolase [Candidatus Nitrospira neomarina]WNM62826.1 transketolase [Candidatus Nitrospira neomarina]